ncbi:MAG: thioredoxin domain-containing protein, partial [Acidobacteriota bacterium]
MTHPHPASRSLSLALLVALVPALLLAGACGSAPASSTGTTTSVQAPAPDTGAQDVLAVVNGEEVTLADLQDLVGDQLGQMDFNYRSQRHRVIDNAMRHYVRDQLIEAEAAKRDMTVDELTEEIGADQEAVSEDDVRMFYLQNQAQLQGRPYESIAPQIRLYLEDQRRQSALQEFADGIAETYGATYMLEPFRVSLDVTGAPVYGREDAPVTLVEFSDFQCPYCESFVPTLQRIKDDYADDVKIVFMHFPLRQIHPNAQKSAEASMCAFDQGKFWEAHDMYFAEQDTLDVEDL